MWLMTRYGFFSVATAKDGDASKMLIRARVREHLAALIQFGQLEKQTEILENVGTDYKYRIYVSKETLDGLMKQLVDDIDYDNFKNAAAKQKTGNKPYMHFLHKVWSKGWDLQSSSSDFSLP